jgi:transcriptional regulator with XRE-family HTH domain
MTRDYYADTELAAYLRAELKRRGESQRQWALRMKISEAYVSDFLQGRRRAGPGILRALGFEEAPYFRRLK